MLLCSCSLKPPGIYNLTCVVKWHNVTYATTVWGALFCTVVLTTTVDVWRGKLHVCNARHQISIFSGKLFGQEMRQEVSKFKPQLGAKRDTFILSIQLWKIIRHYFYLVPSQISSAHLVNWLDIEIDGLDMEHSLKPFYDVKDCVLVSDCGSWGLYSSFFLNHT